MGPLDWLLLLIAGACVAISLYQRFVRTVFMAIGAYVGTLFSALLYQEAAFRLKAIGHEKPWFEGLVFILLFLLIFLAFYFVSRAAYRDTSLPKLGFLDHLLGGRGGRAGGRDFADNPLQRFGGDGRRVLGAVSVVCPIAQLARQYPAGRADPPAHAGLRAGFLSLLLCDGFSARVTATLSRGA